MRQVFKRLSKCFAAITLCLGMAQTVSAQEGIKVMVPVSNRFVEVTADNINVRRLPNATSGKIMVWNSDAGSYDTYTKIFYSDTEANQYRTNRSSGAYVSGAYHPNKGDLLIVASGQQEPKDGWYNVIVNAEEYAGNPGQGNAKLGWIKGDFCKSLEIACDGSINNVKFPEWVKYDFETDTEKHGRDVKPDENVMQRSFGKYSNLKLHIVRDEESNNIMITMAVVADNFLLVARQSIEVMQDSEMSSDFDIDEVEDDMGESSGLAIKMKSSTDMLSNAVKALMKCPDSKFQSVVDDMFPFGKFPTNEVYVMTKDGKRKCISFETNAVGQEFKTYTLK